MISAAPFFSEGQNSGNARGIVNRLRTRQRGELPVLEYLVDDLAPCWTNCRALAREWSDVGAADAVARRFNTATLHVSAVVCLHSRPAAPSFFLEAKTGSDWRRRKDCGLE